MKNQTSFDYSNPEKAVPLLKEHSKNSQRSFAILIKEEKNKGNAQKIKQFWIVNAISLHASPEFIERLSKRDDIASVELDSEFVTKEDYLVRISGSTIDYATSEIKQINATKAWELGIAGKGINVSVIDTGINLSHPDIAGRVTGWVDIDGNRTLPYDNHGHGTHVSGAVAILLQAARNNFAIYTINGTVEDHITKTGIANAIVSTNTSISTVTDSSGFYL